MRPPGQQREQSVVGPDEVTARHFQHRRFARSAHTGIDHGQHHGADGQVTAQRGEQVGAGMGIEIGQGMQQVDHRHVGRECRQYRLQLSDVGVMPALVAKQQQHRFR